jgi:hypothetical protein
MPGAAGWAGDMVGRYALVKISSEGTLNVFGRVEGELHASPYTTLSSHLQFCSGRQPLHNDGERNAGWCEICAWGIGGWGLGGISSRTEPGTRKRSRNFGELGIELRRWYVAVDSDGGFGRSAAMPTWRADYFDNPRDNAPSRSEIIVAQNESDALHEVRSKMGSLCSRAEVIPLEAIAKPQSLAA